MARRSRGVTVDLTDRAVRDMAANGATDMVVNPDGTDASNFWTWSARTVVGPTLDPSTIASGLDAATGVCAED